MAGPNTLNFASKVVFLNGEAITLPSDASNPGTAVAGDLYYNTTSNTVNYYNGTTWIVLGTEGGGGTVTSVALLDGSTTPIYNISGSPITGSGILDFTLVTQPANTVFAGPTSGSAQPTFRALVASDIPSLAYANESLSNLTNPTAINQFLTFAGTNVGLGQGMLAALTSGTNNIAIGTDALQDATTQVGAIAIGHNALLSVVSSSNNENQMIAIGFQALKAWTAGTSSPFGGEDGSIAIGGDALLGNTTGDGNIAIGTEALYQGTTLSGNTAIGHYTACGMNSGNANTAVGYGAFSVGGSAFTGSYNSIVGFASLSNLTTTDSSNNSTLGYGAGSAYAQYNECVLIGSGADTTANNQTNAIAIGYGVLAASNTVKIGNSSILNTDLSGSVTVGGYVQLPEITTPADPPSGSLRFYSKTGDALYYLNSSGVETKVGTGNGTVTSVGLSLPTSVFTTSGSPVSTAGTLTAVFNTETANTVFAGPTTGSAATPTFRALVAADVPTLNQNTTGTATDITATSNSTLTTLSALTSASSLATVGTITTGVWEGTVIGSAYLPTPVTSGLRTINAQTGTTYTFALSDGSGYGNNPLVTFGNAGATTVTVPLNSSVAFPVGTQIDCIQEGAGAVTFTAAGGVTLVSNGGLVIGAQYVGVSLIQTAANTWTIIGYLT
jgi:hypothetical protein